jgi:hypothetical protein
MKLVKKVRGRLRFDAASGVMDGLRLKRLAHIGSRPGGAERFANTRTRD